MKQKTFLKSILSVLLVSALVILGVVVSKGNAIASATTTDTCTEAVWELYSADTNNKYADYRATGTDGYTAPTKDGYVFAGWYDAENRTPLSETAANAETQAYAKFVPAHILTVKAQITDAWTYGQTEADNAGLKTSVTTSAIRLITTVDTLKYQNIGFLMTIGETTYDSIVINEMNGNDTRNIVYSKLYAVGEKEGEPISYYPSFFCNMSKYFKTFTFTGIPVSDFNDYISAKAYWTTVDGTKVCGEESVKTVNLGRANGKATTEDATFVNPFEALRETTISELPYNLFYETLEGALAGTKDEDLTSATIEVIKDVDVDAQITVDANLTDCTDIKITNCVTTLPVKNAESEVVLTKAVATSGANMFNVAGDYSLTIEGANNQTKTGITIDGNTKDTKASLISNAGTLAVKNATVENAMVTDNSGGAISNSGTLDIDNADFTNNKVEKASGSAQGGAINITAGAVTITNTKFEENSATKDGGAIRNASSTAIKIANCEFISNTTGKAGELVKNSNGDIIGGAGENSQGGAIYMTSSSSFTADSVDNVFTGNSAPKGGALCYNSSADSSVEKWSFDNNSAYAYIVLTNTKTTDADGNMIYTSSTAEGNAGAVYVNNGTLELTNAEFTNNATTRQGGAINANAGTLKANNCTFTGNTANTDGGAIRCAKVMEINNCTFDSNKSGTKGGAIYLTADTGVIQNSAGNKFIGNSVSGSGSNGLGGALYVANGTCTVSGWTFEDNSATTSGNDIAVAAGKSMNLSDSTFDNSEVTLMMNGDSVGVANISGELKDVTFRYYGYDGTSTISSGITVSATKIADTSDIKIIPYTSAAGIPVVFGSVSELTNAELERFGATSVGDGKHFGVDTSGQLAYVNVAKNETTEIGYETLADAISGATAEDTITLLRDIEIGSRLENSKDLTIQAPTDRSVTIYTASNLTSNLLKVTGSTSLTITSNGNNTITFDGRTVDKAVEGATEGTATMPAMLYVLGDLTMKDVTVQYAKTQTGSASGALQLNENSATGVAGKLNLDGCVFNSNVSVGSVGGAIHIQALYGTSSLEQNVTHEIKNTTFINNSTTANAGGAIYMVKYTKANVTDCTFVNNTAGTNGGAIYTEADTVLTLAKGEGTVACMFEKNATTGTGSGGALYVNGSVTVDGYHFDSNTTKSNGGAIYTASTSSVEVSDTDFTNNKAYGYVSGTTTTSGKGAAVYVYTTSAAGVEITGCDFTGNQASGDAGGIYHNDGMLYVTDCNFTNNACSQNPSDEDTNFVSANGNGGAIYLRGDAEAVIDATAYDCYSFTGNTADRESSNTYTWGAIAANSSGDVRYSGKYMFENNTHGTAGTLGIGVEIHQASTADSPRAITQINDADNYDALVKAVSKASTTHQTEITLLNDIVIDGARIEVLPAQDIIIQNAAGTDVSIYRATTISNNMFHIQADGQLKFTSTKNDNNQGSLTIDGRPSATGEAIAKASMLYVRGSLILDGVTVQYGKNSSTDGGAAIRALRGTVDIDNCTFANNNETNGGAISLVASEGAITCTIDGSTFEDNTATSYGGALYIPSKTNAVSCTITGSTFTNNTATFLGGAIYTSNSATDSLLTVTGCNFGKVTSSTGEDETVTYTYSDGNTASHGGAMYVNAGTVNVGTTNFYDNEANSVKTPVDNKANTYGGGAICQVGGTLNITGSGEFAGNKATGNQGGAVYSHATCTITGYTFRANEAKVAGGALRTQGTLTVENSNFYNNKVTNGNAGAIYVTTANGKLELKVTDSNTYVFEGNTCSGCGSAIAANTNVSRDNIVGLNTYSYGTEPAQTVTNTSGTSFLTTAE